MNALSITGSLAAFGNFHPDLESDALLLELPLSELEPSAFAA